MINKSPEAFSDYTFLIVMTIMAFYVSIWFGLALTLACVFAATAMCKDDDPAREADENLRR
jgi:hypothetical protein